MVVQNRMKDIKKYWITFVVALFVALVVVAVFSLLLNSRRTNWITKDSGVGRENIFPYVFTCDDGLFVLVDENTVLPVDTETSCELYDAEFKKIYYVENNTLFEYDLSKKYRKVLCDDVIDFRIFPERTAILCTGTKNELKLYYCETKKSEVLCNKPFTNPEDTVQGKNTFTFKVKNGDNCELCYCNLEGKQTVLSQNLEETSPVFIFDNDRLVVYETKNGVEIYNVKADSSAVLENSKLVYSKIKANADYFEDFVTVKQFDECKNIKYVITDITDDGIGNLSYIKLENRKVTVQKVASGVAPKYIVNYDEEDDIVVFAKASEIYYSIGGAKPKLITKVSNAAKVYFDASANNLFVSENDSVYYINVFDKNFSKIDVFKGNAIRFDSYPNKDVCAIISDNNDVYYVLSGNRVEKNDFGEMRLYGNSDAKYFQLRLAEDGSTRAIDFVDANKYVRISSNAKYNVVFDKKLENILYESDGELVLNKSGENIKIGKFSGIKTVMTVANIK